MIGTDDDEAWLALIAFGEEPQNAAAQEIVQADLDQTEPRPEPIAASFVTRVTTGLEGQGGTGSEEVVITGTRKGKEISVEGTDPPAPKNKKRKPAEDGEGHSKKKKSKSSSSSRYRSFALDKPFMKKRYTEYVDDPIAAAIHTILHMQDIADGYKTEGAETIRELTEERDRDVAELGRLQENLRLTTVTLVTNRSLLKKQEAVVDRLTKDCNEEKERVRQLHDLVQQYENKEAAQSVEMQKLVLKVADLEARLSAANSPVEGSGSSGRVAELEKKLAASEEKSRKVARLAFDYKGKYFHLALDQVIAVNPSMASMRALFDPSCVVEDGNIVKINPTTKAKEVVYRPQAN